MRINTLKAVFDRSHAKPTALEIHEWIDRDLGIKLDQLEAIQLVGYEQAVYIKVTSKTYYEKLLREHEGDKTVKLGNGAIAIGTISAADTEIVNVRVFNVPMETPNDRISRNLTMYGKVLKVTNEQWSNGYPYPTFNGIRSVQMSITKVIPSNLMIAGHKAYVTYSGQLRSCFICNETTHLKESCPQRKFNLRGLVQQRKPLLMSDLMKEAQSAPRTPEMEIEVVDSIPEKLRDNEVQDGGPLIHHRTVDDRQDTPSNSLADGANYDYVADTFVALHNTEITTTLSDSATTAGDDREQILAFQSTSKKQKIDSGATCGEVAVQQGNIAQLCSHDESPHDTVLQAAVSVASPSGDQDEQSVDMEGLPPNIDTLSSKEFPPIVGAAAPKIKTVRAAKEQEILQRFPYASAKDPRLLKKK